MGQRSICGTWFLGIRHDNLLRTFRFSDNEELRCGFRYEYPAGFPLCFSERLPFTRLAVADNLGLLVGCIVAGACGYFDKSGITAAPVGSFIWVHTFKLSLYGPLVLPFLAVYVV